MKQTGAQHIKIDSYIKFVLDLDPRSHISKDQFVKLNWIPMSSRVDQITLSHVFKFYYNKASNYMREISFQLVVSITSLLDFVFLHSLAVTYSIPKGKRFGQKTFSQKGCSLWNDLPQSVRDYKHLTRFKYSVKSNLQLVCNSLFCFIFMFTFKMPSLFFSIHCFS